MKSFSIALDWFIAPLLIFSGYKSFRDNSALGSTRLNRWGLHVFRVRLAASMAQLRRLLLGMRVPVTIRQAYQTNGFVLQKDFLSPSEFDGLRDEVFKSDWLVREMRQGNALTRKVFLDPFQLKNTHPHLHRLLFNKDLLARLRYVAGTGGEPLFAIQALQCDEGKQTDPQMVLHQDTFHSTAKAWLFLEDVAEDGCPFAYVPGSHLRTPRKLLWEYRQSLIAREHSVLYHARGSFRASPDDIAAMELPEPVRFAVSANTLIVADTYGFHARSPAVGRAVFRIEIYASLRRNPFLPWTGLDFFSLPFVRNHRAAWVMGLLKLFARWGWMPMPWRVAGLGKICAPDRSAQAATGPATPPS
jgi:hypothetical protein